jgi:DNA repair exonuclease SbcCD ATPase subunit
MARPSDREYELSRQIKDLKDQIHKLQDENKKLKKAADKSAHKDENPKKPAKLISKPCPDCGAEIKITDLPHATMELCSAACGHRNVKSK